MYNLLLMAEEFEVTSSWAVYVHFTITGHPLLVNDLNVQSTNPRDPHL